jgi:hypothetical protein
MNSPTSTFLAASEDLPLQPIAPASAPSAEAYEQMVIQMWVAQGMLTHLEIKRLLAAIGVTPPAKTTK